MLWLVFWELQFLSLFKFIKPACWFRVDGLEPVICGWNKNTKDILLGNVKPCRCICRSVSYHRNQPNM